MGNHATANGSYLLKILTFKAFKSKGIALYLGNDTLGQKQTLFLRRILLLIFKLFFFSADPASDIYSLNLGHVFPSRRNLISFPFNTPVKSRGPPFGLKSMIIARPPRIIAGST